MNEKIEQSYQENSGNQKLTTYYGEFKVQSWLYSLNISSGAKATFINLTCCSGGQNHTWVSQKHLAKIQSVSVRTIQRYLNELIENKLIKKTRQYLKNQFRCVYFFLEIQVKRAKKLIEKVKVPKEIKNKSLKVSDYFEDNNKKELNTKEKLSNKTENNLFETKISEKDRAKNFTTSCRVRGDNLACSYNKVESGIKEKEIPPYPPKNFTEDIPASESSSDIGGDNFLKSLEEENPKIINIKNLLLKKLGQRTFNIWIEPIIFEISNKDNLEEIILRAANSFSLAWLKTHYFSVFKELMDANNIKFWRLDLYTNKQTEDLNEELKVKEIHAEREKNYFKKQEEETLENLNIEEKFTILLSEYPKKTAVYCAKKEFLMLNEQGKLPKFKILLNAIRQNKKIKSWNIDDGRWIPLLKNWLKKCRWLDCQIKNQ